MHYYHKSIQLFYLITNVAQILFYRKGRKGVRKVHKEKYSSAFFAKLFFVFSAVKYFSAKRQLIL